MLNLLRNVGFSKCLEYPSPNTIVIWRSYWVGNSGLTELHSVTSQGRPKQMFSTKKCTTLSFMILFIFSDGWRKWGVSCSWRFFAWSSVFIYVSHLVREYKLIRLLRETKLYICLGSGRDDLELINWVEDIWDIKQKPTFLYKLLVFESLKERSFEFMVNTSSTPLYKLFQMGTRFYIKHEFFKSLNNWK